MANSFYMDASALAKRYIPEKDSFPLIVAHSLNSTDAIILKSALGIARRLRAAGADLVLVASDQRLLRAAQAEGLPLTILRYRCCTVGGQHA